MTRRLPCPPRRRPRSAACGPRPSTRPATSRHPSQPQPRSPRLPPRSPRLLLPPNRPPPRSLRLLLPRSASRRRRATRRPMCRGSRTGRAKARSTWCARLPGPSGPPGAPQRRPMWTSRPRKRTALPRSPTTPPRTRRADTACCRAGGGPRQNLPAGPSPARETPTYPLHLFLARRR